MKRLGKIWKYFLRFENIEKWMKSGEIVVFYTVFYILHRHFYVFTPTFLFFYIEIFTFFTPKFLLFLHRNFYFFYIEIFTFLHRNFYFLKPTFFFVFSKFSNWLKTENFWGKKCKNFGKNSIKKIQESFPRFCQNSLFGSIPDTSKN